MKAATYPTIFATFPPSSIASERYLEKVADIARWCEAGGCTGALVYTDNSLVDPWMVAQEVIRATDSLCPLVAVQPVYMHPYSVAKMVASLAELYGRRVFLNMVAGGFVNDLAGLGDDTEHDRRYDRLIEYSSIIQRLISDDGPVTLEGDWYRVKNLRLKPSVEMSLRPGFMVSGSSPAGMGAARALGATAVQYPKPATGYDGLDEDEMADTGIRIGMIARADGDEAWRVAEDRFPGEAAGRVKHRLAMATTDSLWHRQLSDLGKDASTGRSPYWLHPFENYKTFCPYLVGSYEDVAGAIAGYLAVGFSTFILDVPLEPDDLTHSRTAFEIATKLVRTA